ncbi:3-hydroxyacyl-CoA dehydrogenase NAD-binding domain-containing protein [Mucilaginibacter kameinonensis]|uniref:3-hydroxyacyl-CoA dehydrogenase NAD-binding domain-containing protein n=1 Tax=Mucilaginibacter kameinonensis TaxID=452286 RepID=UPI000EF7B718|nr:3-hydroxyacyl-CoA dehydrogenase NAD-binding domain-containing protein [Mucilaginibacter kameinonensis]
MTTTTNPLNEKSGMVPKDAKVTVIGAGVIGISWAGLFLANGLKVTVNDVRPDLEESTLKGLNELKPSLQALGYQIDHLESGLSFEKDLAKALEGADYVQENGPENIQFKQNLYVNIEAGLKSGALVLSSSSGIPATVFAEKMKDPSRVLVGHPFNPPHLIPLVEIVPGKQTSEAAISDAKSFYAALGKKPVVINKEVPGFVANRLQAAIFRECVYLVSEEVVRMESLDDIVSNSIGLRWAAAGPFKTFTLGGGPGGFSHFLEHFGPGLEQLWQVLGSPHFDKTTVDKLVEQETRAYGQVLYEDLQKERDNQQLAIMAAKKQ